MCLHDYNSAVDWARTRRACVDRGNDSPLTITTAFRIAYGVELVLTDFIDRQPSDQSEEIWREILNVAAWYILNFVARHSMEKTSTGDSFDVAVTWGRAMSELVAQIREIPRLLEREDENLIKIQRELTPLICDQQFVCRPNVEVKPMIGIIGSNDPQVEANKNAQALANIFGCRSRQLSEFAFASKKTNDVDANDVVNWNDTDAAVFTCTELHPYFGKKVVAALPPRLYDDISRKNAIGEIGGLFLNEAGHEVVPEQHVRIGMTYKQLQRVAEKGGAILVVGAEKGRLPTAYAALKGRLVSTVITDINFAIGLLERVAGASTT